MEFQKKVEEEKINEEKMREVVTTTIIDMLNQDFSQLQLTVSDIMKYKENINELDKKKLGETYYWLKRMEQELEVLIRLQT